jgi:dGTPase
MRRYGDRFDHNLHALRIVESFEQRYAAFPGLNLTFEVREGIVKHSRDLDPDEASELDEYLPKLRPVLEAQLIDLADEAAYNTADIDDAYSAGIFTIEELCTTVPHCGAIFEEVETQYPGATERARFYELLRRLINWLVSGLVEGTCLAAEEAQVMDAEHVRRHPHRLARFSALAQAANAELKRFLHRRVYHSAELIEERRRSATAIAELFELFVAQPERMPAGYREQASAAPLHRVVCDYIAGMTDGFFWRTHRGALGPERT